MARSIYVVGEIVGASGLASSSRSSFLSFKFWSSKLALNLSSEEGHYCKWRVHFADANTMPVQERSIIDTESLGSSGQSEGSWKVLQGEISGQTHVAYGYGRSQLARHESCECSVSDNSDPYSIDDTTSRILLDAVWGHPIDLQLICQEDEELTKWPTFELEVLLLVHKKYVRVTDTSGQAWSVNKFGLHSFCASFA